MYGISDCNSELASKNLFYFIDLFLWLQSRTEIENNNNFLMAIIMTLQ